MRIPVTGSAGYLKLAAHRCTAQRGLLCYRASWKGSRSLEPETLNVVVIGMGYVGIPCAALLADVDGFNVIGVQRRSERSG